MRSLLVTSVATIVGWKVGENLIPPAAELEGAIYPWVGAIVGAIVGLGASAAIRLWRRSDGEETP